MKPHELMLKGYAMVGKQCTDGGFYTGRDSKHPTSVCALGAVCFGATGDAFAHGVREEGEASMTFQRATGCGICEANDHGMSIEDIAGILKAEGA